MDQTLLNLAVADALRDRRVARGVYTRGDAFNRNRKAQRARRYCRSDTGAWCQPTSLRAANQKAMSAIVTRRVEAQQEIELWLRKRGYSWRALVETIRRDYRGDWSKIADAMVRFGHVKQARET